MDNYFLVGADPELLLVDENDKFFPVIGLLGGTKYEPLKVRYGAVQEDNVMAEFNVTPQDLPEELHFVLSEVRKHIAKTLSEHKLRISDKCAGDYDPEHLKHPQALEAGCEPDYNAWTRTRNKRPKVTKSTLRTAGGHIHIGFPGDFVINKQAWPEISHTDVGMKFRCELVKWLDFYLGIPSIIRDKDTRRKELYGKIGAHRPKSYGVEYRVLSNFWIFDLANVTWVFNGIDKAITQTIKGKKLSLARDYWRMQQIINTGNVVEAENFMIRHHNLY